MAQYGPISMAQYDPSAARFRISYSSVVSDGRAYCSGQGRPSGKIAAGQQEAGLEAEGCSLLGIPT